MTVATNHAFSGRNKKDLSIYLCFLNSSVQQVFLKCSLDASAILTCDLTVPSPCSQGDQKVEIASKQKVRNVMRGNLLSTVVVKGIMNVAWSSKTINKRNFEKEISYSVLKGILSNVQTQKLEKG